MQLFIAVLTDGAYVPEILRKLSDNNFHGSVTQTKSIRHAFMDSVEPEPYFGGLNKVMNTEEEVSRPMIFVVVKNDEEVKTLASLVREAIGGAKNKGFVYSLPINFLEGLD